MRVRFHNVEGAIGAEQLTKFGRVRRNARRLAIQRKLEVSRRCDGAQSIGYRRGAEWEDAAGGEGTSCLLVERSLDREGVVRRPIVVWKETNALDGTEGRKRSPSPEDGVCNGRRRETMWLVDGIG